MDKKTKIAALRDRIEGPQWFVNNLSFIVFLAFMVIVIIYNSHVAEKKLIAIHKLNSEIRELEYEHSSIKKKLKSQTVMSKLVEDLDGKVVFPEKGPTIVGPDKS